MSNVYDGNLDKQNTGGSSFMVPRADLRPEIFDNAVNQKGYRVIWEQALFCPCITPESGQPAYECPACYGKGYMYIRPQQIRALVTSINGRKDQHRIGLDEVGGAYLTPPSSHNVGFRDRFTFIDFTAKFSQIVTRGLPGEVDKLRYNCLKVIALFTVEKEYHYGVDFKLTEDNMSIEWLGNAPETDERYSILYDMRPVYIAMNPIHELRGTYTNLKAHGMEKFQQLPKQFQIRREDFVDEDTGLLQNEY